RPPPAAPSRQPSGRGAGDAACRPADRAHRARARRARPQRPRGGAAPSRRHDPPRRPRPRAAPDRRCRPGAAARPGPRLMTAPAPAIPSDDAPHLLVVDDDRRIRALLLRFLVAEGYRVSTAETAHEARAKLLGLKFDLLVLDVMMPGENGFDLVKAIRTSSAVPILMLTARDEKESRIMGLEIGADDY